MSNAEVRKLSTDRPNVIDRREHGEPQKEKVRKSRLEGEKNCLANALQENTEARDTVLARMEVLLARKEQAAAHSLVDEYFLSIAATNQITEDDFPSAIFSVRTAACLENAGFSNLRSIANSSVVQLLSIRQVSVACLNEIVSLLQEHKIKLGKDLDWFVKLDTLAQSAIAKKIIESFYSKSRKLIRN